MNRLYAGVAAALLVGGCGIEIDYSGSRFQCDENAIGELCPVGMRCVAGFCEPANQLADASDVDAPVADASLADAGPSSVTVRVNASTDDAEENLADGTIDLTSTDLELAVEPLATPVNQRIGMRFANVEIPNGAEILDARIQFTVDEVIAGDAQVELRTEASDSAATFDATIGSITARDASTAAVTWTIPPWPTADVTGADQRTPNLAAIIQEVVNRPGWASGNSIVVLVTGTGTRTAESFDGVPGSAPALGVLFNSP